MLFCEKYSVKKIFTIIIGSDIIEATNKGMTESDACHTGVIKIKNRRNYTWNYLQSKNMH